MFRIELGKRCWYGPFICSKQNLGFRASALAPFQRPRYEVRRPVARNPAQLHAAAGAANKRRMFLRDGSLSDSRYLSRLRGRPLEPLAQRELTAPSPAPCKGYRPSLPRSPRLVYASSRSQGRDAARSR